MGSDLVNIHRLCKLLTIIPIQHLESINYPIRNIFLGSGIKLLMIMFLLPLTDRILIYTIYENGYANIFYVVLL